MKNSGNAKIFGLLLNANEQPDVVGANGNWKINKRFDYTVIVFST